MDLIKEGTNSGRAKIHRRVAPAVALVPMVEARFARRERERDCNRGHVQLIYRETRGRTIRRIPSHSFDNSAGFA